MNIGSTNAINAGDIAAEMADRVRSAHRSAEQNPEAVEISAPDRPARDPEAIDDVGAALRTKLEAVVADVVAAEGEHTTDLLTEVVDIVVADRLERADLPDGQDYAQRVAEQMRNDPVIVAELDDLLQSIAYEMAVRGS